MTTHEKIEHTLSNERTSRADPILTAKYNMTSTQIASRLFVG